MTLSTILFEKIKIEHLSLKFREILTLGIIFSVEQIWKLIFSTLLIQCLGNQNIDLKKIGLNVYPSHDVWW